MVNTKSIHYGKSWYTANLMNAKKCTFKVYWFLCTTRIPVLFQKITQKMTVTMLYKKLSTSWPQERLGPNFLLACISIISKQVHAREGRGSLWSVQNEDDFGVLPMTGGLHLLSLVCTGRPSCQLPHFQHCLWTPNTSCDVGDCRGMEIALLPKITLSSNDALQ